MATRRFIAVYVCVFCLLLAASAQRLSDLTLSTVPLSLWLPFVGPLVSATFEMALLTALPAALLAANVSGASRIVIASAYAIIVALTVATTAFMQASVNAPGRIAQRLIDSARVSCSESAGRKVEVPIVPVVWSCPPGRRPIASGHIAAKQPVQYEARSLALSEDLREIKATGLRVQAEPQGERPGLIVTVKRAHVTGLRPWGRPLGSSSRARLIRNALTALAMTLTGLAIFRWRRYSFWLAVALGAGAGLVPLFVQRTLDRSNGSVFLYWLAALAGPVTLFLGWLAFSSISATISRRS